MDMINLANGMADALVKIQTGETHCMALATEAMKAKTPNFERTEFHFEADCLLMTYHSSLDDRDYQVRITALK